MSWARPKLPTSGIRIRLPSSQDGYFSECFLPRTTSPADPTNIFWIQIEDLQVKADEADKLNDQMDEYRHATDKLHKAENVIEKYKRKLEESADLRRSLKVSLWPILSAGEHAFKYDPRHWKIKTPSSWTRTRLWRMNTAKYQPSSR
jgi:hypothetical protein